MTRLRDVVQDSFRHHLDEGDITSYLDTFTPDCFVTFLGETSKGRSDYGRMLEGFIDAVTKGRHDVVFAIDTDDTCVSEVIWTGRHTGPLRWAGHEIPATGRWLQWTLCLIDRFEGDRICERHVFADQLELMTSLGLLPEAAA